MGIKINGKTIIFASIIFLIIAFAGCVNQESIDAGCSEIEATFGGSSGVSEGTFCIPPQGSTLSILVGLSGKSIDTSKTAKVHVKCTRNGFPASMFAAWQTPYIDPMACNDGCVIKTDNTAACSEEIQTAGGTTSGTGGETIANPVGTTVELGTPLTAPNATGSAGCQNNTACTKMEVKCPTQTTWAQSTLQCGNQLKNASGDDCTYRAICENPAETPLIIGTQATTPNATGNTTCTAQSKACARLEVSCNNGTTWGPSSESCTRTLKDASTNCAYRAICTSTTGTTNTTPCTTTNQTRCNNNNWETCGPYGTNGTLTWNPTLLCGTNATCNPNATNINQACLQNS
ncbi:MAG: hypothetical protein PHH08_01030 [Candidatus ainarchaeum sp.]|nr:hypothetical protein [Candidatus ainarchaeum sp.]